MPRSAIEYDIELAHARTCCRPHASPNDRGHPGIYQYSVEPLSDRSPGRFAFRLDGWNNNREVPAEGIRTPPPRQLALSFESRPIVQSRFEPISRQALALMKLSTTSALPFLPESYCLSYSFSCMLATATFVGLAGIYKKPRRILDECSEVSAMTTLIRLSPRRRCARHSPLPAPCPALRP
jgi:hypothetical protein